MVGGTVLLVEDEEMVRRMSKAMLMVLGFTVIEAVDGVNAIEVFKQHKNEISAVICDLSMPNMNGWETLAVLRKLEPEIPLILSSGYYDSKIMDGDHTEYPQALLGKPFTVMELSDTLNHVLSDKRHKGQTF